MTPLPASAFWILPTAVLAASSTGFWKSTPQFQSLQFWHWDKRTPISVQFLTCRSSQRVPISQPERHKLCEKPKAWPPCLTKKIKHVNGATDWWIPKKILKISNRAQIVEEKVNQQQLSGANYIQLNAGIRPRGGQIESLCERNYGRRGLHLSAESFITAITAPGYRELWESCSDYSK